MEYTKGISLVYHDNRRHGVVIFLYFFTRKSAMSFVYMFVASLWLTAEIKDLLDANKHSVKLVRVRNETKNTDIIS